MCRVDGDSHQLAANSISAWESAYFGSEFTHPSGAVFLSKASGGIR
jgi:hypothetical protein